MRPQYSDTLIQLNKEISEIAKDLPQGKYHQVINRCNRSNLIIKKTFKKEDSTDEMRDIRFSAQMAIFHALLNGRHLSQMDCAEFMIEDMRTPISHMKGKFPDTHVLRSKWIQTPVRKSRIKEYWLEEK